MRNCVVFIAGLDIDGLMTKHRVTGRFISLIFGRFISLIFLNQRWLKDF